MLGSWVSVLGWWVSVLGVVVVVSSSSSLMEYITMCLDSTNKLEH